MIASNSNATTLPSRMRQIALLCSILSCLMAGDGRGDDPFATTIRPTDPLSPTEQQKTFRLPEGFEVQLFASEPDVQKPINMAFDARGRLWVSGSVEYPYAAKAGKGRDVIRVLEDTDHDGRADKITTFAEGLNIPIGLYPYRDGLVVYSIPNIYFLQDTDGDGRADRRTILYGPLGTPRDVHGLQNAFRRGFDGWLYACHGFSNDSTIQGSDGSKIRLQSGNTYRIRLDGSRVEQFTWGQVNPFGMALTPRGDLFTADCHSTPLSLLLRGGYYPSFGKPHDGLGYVKPVMNHTHGSTAISGAAYYTGTNFPSAYHGSLFVGNVMTSRVHRDSLLLQGSTVRAKEEADFLISDDPWFRPVDVRIGPDGALYVADFYNRIIGHYEVALDHPGRDRKRGRIWRIVYTGNEKSKPPAAKTIDLTRATVPQLIEALGHQSLTYRMLATDQLSDRIGQDAVGPLLQAMRETSQPTTKVHALWVLHRLGKLKPEHLIAAAKDRNPLVRTHVMRLLSESAKWSAEFRDLAMAGLNDPDALVQRAAADALGQHVDYAVVRPLLDALHRVPVRDAHLRQTIRMALRNQLRGNQLRGNQLQAKGTWDRLRSMALSDADNSALADVVLAVGSQEAAAFLVDRIAHGKVTPGQVKSYLAHASRYIPTDQISTLVRITQEKVPDDLDLQLELLLAIEQSLQQRGLRETKDLQDWGRTLAVRLLDSIDAKSSSWGNVTAENPWGLEKRDSADGQQETLFLSSLPGGEQKTAVLRSKPFAIPERLQFYICGHLGFPKDDASPKNFAQLRLVGSGQVIRKALAPRTDTAQRIDWKLDKLSGKQGYLEVVDGLDIGAFAWVAVSRFDPPVVAVPQISPALVAHRQMAAATIARRLKLKSLQIPLRKLVLADYAAWGARAAAAKALAHFSQAGGPDVSIDALVGLVSEAVVPLQLRTDICRQVVARKPQRSAELLSNAMRVVPTRLERQMAHKLAGSRSGGDVLLTLIEQGHASARLLQDKAIGQKLLTAKPVKVTERIEQLTAKLPPVAEQIQQLIAARTEGYHSASASVARGRQLFAKKCAACHQVEGKGAVVGPQLDGIGTRGLERIVEDVLDPNRNVDAAFSTSIYLLEDGTVVTGLFRRREGKTLVVADREGKEIRIAEDDIDKQTRSKTSIMPDNVGTDFTPNEFYDLAAFLLSLRRTEPTPVTWKTPHIDPKFRSEGVAAADVFFEKTDSLALCARICETSKLTRRAHRRNHDLISSQLDNDIQRHRLENVRPIAVCHRHLQSAHNQCPRSNTTFRITSPDSNSPVVCITTTGRAPPSINPAASGHASPSRQTRINSNSSQPESASSHSPISESGTHTT